MKHTHSLILRTVLVLVFGLAFFFSFVPSPLSAALPWTALGYGVNGTVYALVQNGNDLYVGGNFTQVCGNAACDSGNLTVNHIAKWDGTQWSALGYGVGPGVYGDLNNHGPVYALAVDGNTVYAGGYFGLICGNDACDTDNTRVNNIVKWDGSHWSSVANGMTSSVSALIMQGGDLYAGGIFDKLCGNSTCDSGNTTVNSVAKWDGSHWSALGYGLTVGVNTFTVNGSDLYVGGWFARICSTIACDSNNIPANGIAKWDGSSWSAFGNGVSNAVNAILLNGSDLYAGGTLGEFCGEQFCLYGNTPANRIAKWDGSSWSPLANGFDWGVNALVRNGSDLYAMGNLTWACGTSLCSSYDTNNIPINHIARWDGSRWFPFGSGVNDNIFAFSINGSDMYVGGDFTQVCGNAACKKGNLTVNHIARLLAFKSAKPILSTPDNQALVGKRPKFTWTAAQSATSYTIVIKYAATGALKLKQTGLTALSFKPSSADALASHLTYKWYVRACNVFGCTKSATRKITVR